MTAEDELLAAVQQAVNWLVKHAKWRRERAAAAASWAAVQLAQRGAELTPQLIVSVAKYDERALCAGPVDRDAGHREAQPKFVRGKTILALPDDDGLDPLQLLEMLEELREGGEM